jgi:hypothetical protein
MSGESSDLPVAGPLLGMTMAIVALVILALA